MTILKAMSLTVAASLLPATGCSDTIAVQRTVTPGEAVWLSQATAGREVELGVRTPASPAPEAQVLRGALSSPDGKAFEMRMSSQESRTISLERTQSVSCNDRGRGALEGFLVGAIPGLILGLNVGSFAEKLSCNSWDGNPCPPPWGCADAAKTTALLTVGSALVTGLIGAAIGGLVGHRTTFTF